MNYQVQDANGEVIDGYRSNRDSWEKVKDTELADGSKAECLCYAGISDYFNGGKRGGLYNHLKLR